MNKSIQLELNCQMEELIGFELTHMWQGYGSAIFAEFGKLTESFKRDGSPANPSGEISLMIQWSWRIEHQNQILFGAWDDELDWEQEFKKHLVGKKVVDCYLFGKVPEICVELDNGYRVVSFVVVGGDPQWTLFDRRAEDSTWFSIKQGRLVKNA